MSMADPIIGQISYTGTNFAPRGWAFCNGQLLPIAQNTALFSLLGTSFGGDGRTTFSLPNLQGRMAIHPGSGPGLTPRRWGERGGSSQVSLSQINIPSHTHSLNASLLAGDSTSPTGAIASNTKGGRRDQDKGYTNSANTAFRGDALSSTGQGAPLNTASPALGINAVICLVGGVYPSRS